MEWTGEPGIGEHAFLSDCGAAALVDPHGTIDWLCAPGFDSPPLLWSLLDRDRGGSWDLYVEGAAPTRLAYTEDTLVVETLWEGPDCRLRSHDLLAVRPDGEGLRPVGVLVRFLTCLEGRARVRSTLRARPDAGRARAAWTDTGDGALRLREGMLLSGGSAPVLGEEGDPSYRVDLAAGESTALVLDHDRGDRRYGVEEARALLEGSRDAWQAWAARTSYDGNGAQHVRHSAVVLRGLLHEESGGMIAAPTASLPEWPGGPRNWDYRYVWHRDAPLVVLSFLRLGHTHEAGSYLRYLLSTTEGPLDRLKPVHGLDGREPHEEAEVGDVRGYADSRPVRLGNDAHVQHQLDVYGHVLDAVLSYQQVVGDLPEKKVKLADEVVEALRGVWREPDAGIWEVRSGERHWTISKVYAWVCLDRAVQLAQRLGRQEEVPFEDWCRERDTIHAEVLERGYDPGPGTFTQSYGAPRVDGSLLRLPLLGFLEGNDPRIVRTVDRVVEELGGAGALVHRYDPEDTDDGLRTPEGAFLMCSFDLVSALVLAGRVEEAEDRFRRLCGACGDLGLFAEEMSDGGVMLGNFPQAFTHLALIEAAVNLRDADHTEALHIWARHRDGRSPHAESEKG
ncbi:glycoside hydrolase family 15 protein [Nocardiopsis xinjiangensis]|uniref:glycoside hydrolase family 15 protein n=1 Tax=Nocardiopsis xinjiangensis TaxID=124285 RepID=UPI00034606B9|nr:glycoside hydrolase family 15 protein [Nocardiopsis xinjiangensis]